MQNIQSFYPENRSHHDVNEWFSYPDALTGIEGLIHPNSGGHVQKNEKDMNILSFSLIVWRECNANDFHTTPLHVFCAIRENYDDWYKSNEKFQPLSAYSLSAYLNAAENRAVLAHAERQTNRSWDDLQAIAQQLLPPVRIQDDVLGELVFQYNTNWYEGFTTWLEKRIIIHLELPEGGRSTVKNIVHVKSLLADQAGWTRQCFDFAAKKLLKLKNAHWLESGEQPLTDAAFISQLEVESITVTTTGRFIFWCKDGGMFGDHTISVHGSLKSGFKNAAF